MYPPASHALSNDDRARYGVLQAALVDVDSRFQQVLTLRFFGRRSTADIAAVLRCSEAHVRMLQMQALVELQRQVMRP